MEEKKENRGGKRQGAGRKKSAETKKMLLNLELELFEELESANNKTLFINAAVRFALKERGAFKKFVDSIVDKDGKPLALTF
jgi:hypothetical protein